MKLQKTSEGSKVEVIFVAETEEEKRILGSLRDHFFWGNPDDAIYPQYAGSTTEDNFVKSLHFEYKQFEK